MIAVHTELLSVFDNKKNHIKVLGAVLGKKSLFFKCSVFPHPTVKGNNLSPGQNIFFDCLPRIWLFFNKKL